MSIFWAVIIAVLRILAVLAAVILFAAIAMLLLPSAIKGAGFCRVEGNLEEALESLDDCKYEPGDIDLSLFDYGFELDLRVCLGLFSICVSESDFPCLKLFGVKLPFALGGKAVGKGRATEGPAKPLPNRPEKSKWHKKVSLREIKKFIAPQVRSKVVCVVNALFRAAHPKMDLDLELGFPDPSHTGIVYGLFSAYAGAFGVKGVRIHPNFQRQGISAGGKVSVWVIPGQIGWIAGRFAFDKEIRRLWWKQSNRPNLTDDKKQGLS